MSTYGSPTSPITSATVYAGSDGTYVYVPVNTQVTIYCYLNVNAPFFYAGSTGGVSVLLYSGTDPCTITFTASSNGTINWRSIQAISGTITIYVCYQYTHTIAYNANGGSGSMSSTTITDYNSSNTNVTFASNGFTAPTGYYFAGWKIAGIAATYQPGDTYAVGGNGSVTAYADWLPIPIAKTNVNVNGSWVKGSVHVNVDGTWKGSKKIYVKVNGVWEESIG